ncbi:alpha-L-glutamate ligase-like protein [Leptospira sp. 96542]|nr:alpha-L-glutamate ligase-like protein [Leptospira sp. 96542]
MISLVQKFKSVGILGINRRIGEYILPYNPRKNYPLVDDKWKTAELAESKSIPMPDHYGIIEAFGDVQNLTSLISDKPGFVVKPANGGMGNGILVIDKILQSDKGEFSFQKVDGKTLSKKNIMHHISGILSGLYSLDGNSDRAILQEKLLSHPFFNGIAYQGIADIRVIVFLGYPVMAMLRLPTKDSGGRANLHQGALGVGVDLLTGTLTSAVCDDKLIAKHPDTNETLAGRQIPFWQEILTMSAKCFEVSGLGYLGVDIVLDERRGPLLLEMNARPGLGIQIANRMGLTERLEKIERDGNPLESVSERIQRMFGWLENKEIR